MTQTLVPYADNKSMKVGDATIENGIDCISVYGSIDYTMDQAGLALARAMKALLDGIVAVLESERSLPAVLPVKPVGQTKNPFA